MHITARHILRLVGSGGLALLTGCGSQAPAEKGVGTLSMSLATIVNDVRYRLTGDQFQLTGPVERMLQHDGDGSIIYATLPAGDYQVELLDGWTLERQAESGFEPVQAELVSPNPRPVHIESGEMRLVAWVFQTSGAPVELEPGFFQGNLAVVDGSNPADAIFGDVLATEQEHVDALEGIRTVYGNVTLTNRVSSTRALGSLTEIVGALEIASTASLADLRGLEALSSVHGVRITDNAALPSCEARWLIANIEGLGGVVGAPQPDAGVSPGNVEIARNGGPSDKGDGTCPQVPADGG